MSTIKLFETKQVRSLWDQEKEAWFFSIVDVVGVLTDSPTFKENCPDIRNSKVVDMVREFEAWGMKVVVADTWANAEEVAHEYNLQLGQVDADHPVDSLIVAVGHKENRRLTPPELRTLCRGNKPVLADVKSLYNRHDAAAVGFTVFRF